MINWVDKIIETEFTCFKDPLEATQFLRGEMPIYFDSMVSIAQQHDVNEFQMLLEFSEKLQKLTILWFDLYQAKYHKAATLCK